jgi:VCBS repeat-containing protein
MSVLGMYQHNYKEGLRETLPRLMPSLTLGFGIITPVFYLAPGPYFGRGIRKVLTATLLSMIATVMLGAASVALAETNAQPGSSNGSNKAVILSAAEVILTETNEPLSTGGKLTISGVGSPQTFVAQSNVVGTYGTFNINSSGAWTYVTKSALDELKEGQSVSDSFTVSSSDGTTTTVKVTINGTNDPAILGSADVVIYTTNAPLTSIGKLTIKDVDSPETFVAQKKIGTYGSFDIKSTGAWAYVTKDALENLKMGQSVSDSFTVSSADGTTTTVKITINGNNRPATLSAADVVLTETNAPLSTSGKLTIADTDKPTFVAQSKAVGTYGTFDINSAGAWTYATKSALDELKEGQSVVDSFTVSSADGTTTTVKITINGTNDPAILSAADVVLTETNEPLSTKGKLTIKDVDSPETFIAQNKVGSYGTFNINTAGEWTYVTESAFDELKEGQTISDSFIVSSADGTTTTVKVTIKGTNDPAILSSADVVLTETNEPLRTSGKLTIKDVDSPETFVAQKKIGSYGTFSINSAGAWTYVTNSALDELKEGQSVVDSFTVSSADGTTTTVKVTINGTNDPAILSPAYIVLNKTSAPLSTGGKLTIRDVDSPETFVAQSNVAGTYGTFNIDPSGAWTYVPNSALDDLKEGQSVNDSFTVSSADGTTTTVRVTINNGTNVPAILSAADVVLTETNVPLRTRGKLSIKDVDSPQTFVAQSNVAGAYGTFNINSAGAWTYLTKSALDYLKEGQSVSDSFTVSSADGTTTTVKVTINGTNDPAILSSADVVLTETNEALSTGGTLTISDVDSPETFVAQRMIDSHGTFSIDSSGAWTYVTKNALDYLKAGQSVSDSFTVSSADGTTTTVKVTINGTNDPAILSSADVVLTETNEPLSTGGTLTIIDVDSPETFMAQKKVGDYGTFKLDSSGAWTYVTKSALDYLKEGQSVSDSFTVSSADGTTTTVKVTIKGTNDPAILSAADVVLIETNEPLSTGGKLTIKDVDSPETFVAQKKVGDYGTFNIDSSGAWTYVTKSALDELSVGQGASDSFTVSSADGTTTTVKVTIDGTNDPAILSADDVVLIESNEPLSTGGKLTIKDVDSPETFVAQSNVAGTYGTFNIDSSGAWTYVTKSALDELNVGQGVSDSFTVSSADGTTTTVKVTIDGTNDPAILSADDVVLIETNEPLSTAGKLTIKDVDSPETFVAQSNVAGTYGTFNIDSSGAWTYTAKSAFDELNVGQGASDSFTVSSADGTITTVKVTIDGTNDPAILSSADVALNETNVPLRTGGTLTISDVDSPETFVAQRMAAGTYGTFNINSAGAWTYVTNSNLDYLNVGQSVSDSFTVSSADGTTTTVKVTINGTNDPAILSAADVVLKQTNVPLSTGGKLSIRDVDSPQTFVAQSNVAGTNGIFNIDSSGTWTYVTNSALDDLSVGRSAGDIFTVTSADGTPTTVKVTINGTNDPAILSAADVVLKQSNVQLSTGGKLSIRDVDSPQTFVAQINVVGTNGIFNIDSSGVWTYVANSAFDDLNVGQSVSDKFTVSSADGTKTTVRVTINGSNNPAKRK